jgi:hypothetical protein
MPGFNAGGGSISCLIVGGRAQHAPGVAVGFGLACPEKTQIHTGPVVNPGPCNAGGDSARGDEVGFVGLGPLRSPRALPFVGDCNGADCEFRSGIDQSPVIATNRHL